MAVKDNPGSGRGLCTSCHDFIAFCFFDGGIYAQPDLPRKNPGPDIEASHR